MKKGASWTYDTPSFLLFEKPFTCINTYHATKRARK